MDAAKSKPLYILKGENYLRYFSSLCLIGIFILSMFAMKSMGLVMVFVALGAIFGLINVQFPFLYIYEDCFVIEKKGILKRNNYEESYKYADIKQIEFEKGYLNWIQMIVQSILGQGGYGGFSKPD